MQLGILFSFLAAVFWGVVYVVDQKLLEKMSVMKFLFYEHFIWTLFIIAYLMVFGKVSDIPNQGDFNFLKSPAFILLVPLTFVANFLILKSIQSIGATTAVLIEISYPFFVALFAYLLFRQPINKMTLLGGVFIFIGSGIILYFNK